MYIDPKNMSNQSTPAPGLILLTKEQESLYFKYNGFVSISKGSKGENVLTPNVESFECWKSSQPNYLENMALEVRKKRDKLLQDSDWTQIPDSPLNDSQKYLWKQYRQNLRDIPQQSGFPQNVTWPEEPK